MGVIRKLIVINTWFWIIFLSLIVLGIFVLFSSPAFAVDRIEENKIKDEINQNEDLIIEYDENLVEIRIDIREYGTELDIKKNELREIKRQAESSWDALLEIVEYEDRVQESIDNISDARDELKKNLTMKSNSIKLIRELKEFLLFNEPTPTEIYGNLTKKLGIQLSNTCIIMIKNNFTTPCPSYDDLLVLDTSIVEFSGGFTKDEDGYFHRVDPKTTNSWRFYDFDDTPRMFVDPPSGMTDRVKLITIMPNFDNYFITGDTIQKQKFELIVVVQDGNTTTRAINYSFLNQTQDYGRVIYHDRYVDNCNSAVIDAEDWELILVDTINYLRNDCKEEFTEFDNRELIIENKTEIDVTTSPNWNYFKWIDDIKNSCIITRTC